MIESRLPDEEQFRPMIMLGEEINDIEPLPSPDEESKFQADLDAIRVIEEQAWIEGQTIRF